MKCSKVLEKINNDIKFKAFGKVTLKGKKIKKDNTFINNDNNEENCPSYKLKELKMN